jgi:hypothetical protein
VWDTVFGNVLSQRPTMTEAKLNEYRAAHRRGEPGLNAQDYAKAMNALRETREGLIARGRTEALADHQQAEQEGAALLGIPQFGEIYDPVRKKLWPLFLGELRRRSSAYGGKENALRVLEEIGPRYAGAVGAEGRADIETLRGMLRVQGTSAGVPMETGPQIDAAFKMGRINRGQYDNARKLLMEIESKQSLMQQDEERIKSYKSTKGGTQGSGLAK